MRDKIHKFITRFFNKIFKTNTRSRKLIISLFKPLLLIIFKNNKQYSNWLKSKDYFYKDLSKKHKYSPLISVIMPVYKPKPKFLKEAIESVIGQTYKNWELIIVDDFSQDPYIEKIINNYSGIDSRIKPTYLDKNSHISKATNIGIDKSNGDYVSLFDHDDILGKNALEEVVSSINIDRELDFIYTDEDKITESSNRRFDPFFKPDMNPDFMLSVNYITHFSTIRREFLDKIGHLRDAYNGAQDWDLFLRVIENTDKILHIPKILYSWRVHDKSTAKSTDSKPYVVSAQKKAIGDSLSRKGYSKIRISQDKINPGYWNVDIMPIANPMVSIIIPTKNQSQLLKKCIDSIYKNTTYPNYEVILVDTGSDDIKLADYYKEITNKHTNLRKFDFIEDKFSYANSCNYGVTKSKGKYLIFLNNDTEIITKEWIEKLLGDAQRDDIGAVGGMLLYPDALTIQHAGIGIGLGGVAANLFSGVRLNDPLALTQHLMIFTKHNVSAVTAACLMMSRSKFNQINGFDNNFRITYNDVDLCLKLVDAGYRNVYNPNVKVIHHESISLGRPEDKHIRDQNEFIKAKNTFVRKWSKYIKHDPFINANINKDNAFYNIY